MIKNPKILLIDDDHDFVKATSHILRTRQYQIIVASNGEEGIRKMREDKPDLILLDIMMPGKSGYDVAYEISKDPDFSDIPVLALTSIIESLGEPPFAFKVTEYLQKTIKPNDLLEKIEKYLKPNKPESSRGVFP